MKGQRYRFFKDSSLKLRGETSCELHISIETEEAVNKDSNLNYSLPEVVGYSFDASIECHVDSFLSNQSYDAKPSDLSIGQACSMSLGRTSDSDNSVIETEIASGRFIPTSISYKADNKKVVTASIKLEGTGVLTL